MGVKAKFRIVSFVVFFMGLGLIALGQEDIARLRSDLKMAPSDSARLDAYKAIFGYYQLSDKDSATFFLEQGLEEFNKAQYRTGIAYMLSLLGSEDGKHGRIAIARERFTEALMLFKNLNNRDGIARASNGFGVLECRSGNYDAAIKYFLTALKIYEQRLDTTGIINTYINLGSANEQMDNLDIALEYYNKGLPLVDTLSASSNLPNLYNDIGIVYIKMDSVDRSLFYFHKALRGSQSPDLAQTRLSPLTNIGKVYRQLGDDKKAMAYFDQALTLASSLGIAETVIRLKLNKAAIVGKTNPRQGLVMLQPVLAEATRIDQKALKYDILTTMADMYEEMGDYKSALNTSKIQHALEDTMFSLDKEKEIAGLQSVHELQRSREKIEQLEVTRKKILLHRTIIVSIAILLAFVVVALTVSYRRTRSLNAKLSGREKQLNQANLDRDRLFSIIGHDLRGPIANIPGMMDFSVKEDISAEERRYFLDAVKENAIASVETLDKLLNWGKSQMNGIRLNQSVFNASENLQDSLKLLKGAADQKHIVIRNGIPQDLTVFSDPEHFKFIFRNLLSNAIKFTNEYGRIDIQADSSLRPGYIVFSVKDNGVGIDREHLNLVFEAFKVGTVGTANEKGNSIGLMLCKEFVTENGGEIWVESEKGQGSTFLFSLKAAPSA